MDVQGEVEANDESLGETLHLAKSKIIIDQPPLEQ